MMEEISLVWEILLQVVQMNLSIVIINKIAKLIHHLGVYLENAKNILSIY